MNRPIGAGAICRGSEEWENEGGALAALTPAHGERFVLFERSNGSKVACQVSAIHFIATGEHGAILHFGSDSQVNVRQSFDVVLALLNSGTRQKGV
jgi:hypothetical protein